MRISPRRSTERTLAFGRLGLIQPLNPSDTGSHSPRDTRPTDRALAAPSRLTPSSLASAWLEWLHGPPGREGSTPRTDQGRRHAGAPRRATWRALRTDGPAGVGPTPL